MWRWVGHLFYHTIQILRLLLGKFLGQRFIKDNDVGLVLIYDIKGTIAGVQMAVSDWFCSTQACVGLFVKIPTSLITGKYYKFSAVKMFNRDTIAGIDVYVLTAYFVNPRTICQPGRVAQRLTTEGTGTGLWLQNGTDPIRDSFPAPLTEADVTGTKWVKGSCFPTMGK